MKVEENGCHGHSRCRSYHWDHRRFVRSDQKEEDLEDIDLWICRPDHRTYYRIPPRTHHRIIRLKKPARWNTTT